MPREEGRLSFIEGIPNDVAISDYPRTRQDRGNVYLWAIAKDDVPYALEKCAYGATLQTGVIKHTNLTGGADAHCGGEIWFVDSNSILIGGSSGRYGPDTEEQLTDAALAFSAGGYRVASLGFDDDTGFPSTVLVGEPQWM